MRHLTALFMGAALGISVSAQAFAHSFDVALAIPVSGPNMADGEAFRNGFRLATKERDGHPNETSDGHLGGLDVHLSTADIHDAELTGLKALLEERTFDIIVLAGTSRKIDETIASLAGESTVVITPGRLPFADFAQSGLPEESAEAATFVAAFHKEFGRQPSAAAARGYHAARRIDAAVRSLGGVDDKAHLHRMLRQSSTGFSW